jgi:hypothetical protein
MLRSSPHKPSAASIVQQPQLHSSQPPPHNSVLSPSHHLHVGLSAAAAAAAAGQPLGPPMFAADHPTLRLMAVAAAVAAAAGSSSSSSNGSVGTRPGAQPGGAGTSGLNAAAAVVGGHSQHHRQVRSGGAMPIGPPPPPGPSELYASYLYSRGQFDRAAMLHLMQQQQRNPFSPPTAVSSSATPNSSSSSSSTQHNQQQQQRHQQVSQQQRQPPSFPAAAAVMSSTPSIHHAHHYHPTSSGYHPVDAGVQPLPLVPPPYHQQRSPSSPPIVVTPAPGGPGFESYSQSLATLSQLSQRLHLHHHQQQQQQQLSQPVPCYQSSTTSSSSRMQSVHGAHHTGMMKMGSAEPSSAPRGHGSVACSGNVNNSPSPPTAMLSTDCRPAPAAASRTTSRSRSAINGDDNECGDDDDVRKMPTTSPRGHLYNFESDGSSPPRQHTDDDYNNRHGRRSNDADRTGLLLPPHNQLRQQQHQQVRERHHHHHHGHKTEDAGRHCRENVFIRQSSNEPATHGAYDVTSHSATSFAGSSSSADQSAFIDRVDGKLYRSAVIHSRRTGGIDDEDGGDARRLSTGDDVMRRQLQHGRGEGVIANAAAKDLMRSSRVHRHRETPRGRSPTFSDDEDAARHAYGRIGAADQKLIHRGRSSSSIGSSGEGSGTEAASKAEMASGVEATRDGSSPWRHFVKGSAIQLANGRVKRVEDLDTDDFEMGSSIVDGDDGEAADYSSGEEESLKPVSSRRGAVREPNESDFGGAAAEMKTVHRSARGEDADSPDGQPVIVWGKGGESSTVEARNGPRRACSKRWDDRRHQSRKLVVEASRVVHMRQNHDSGTAVLGFAVGPDHDQVMELETHNLMANINLLVSLTNFNQLASFQNVRLLKRARAHTHTRATQLLCRVFVTRRGRLSAFGRSGWSADFIYQSVYV